ncbi:hypothetical protein [Paenibacillus sp. CMAA1364]
MYEGFIEMQRVVTRVQYSRDQGPNQEEYHRLEYATERNNLHTPERTGAKEESICDKPMKVTSWWRH